MNVLRVLGMAGVTVGALGALLLVLSFFFEWRAPSLVGGSFLRISYREPIDADAIFCQHGKSLCYIVRDRAGYKVPLWVVRKMFRRQGLEGDLQGDFVWARQSPKAIIGD